MHRIVFFMWSTSFSCFRLFYSTYRQIATKSDLLDGCHFISDVPISVSKPLSSSKGMEYRWLR